MKTFVQLLRVAFWMLPLQRGLTVVGAVLTLTSVFVPLPFGMPGSTLPAAFLGVALMVITPVLAGGVFLRLIVAPRATRLLPNARPRLLFGTFGVVLVAVLLWVGTYWLVFQQAPLEYRPKATAYVMMFLLTLSFATQCTIAQFIAARGPVWLLLSLTLWQMPYLVVRLLRLPDASQLQAGPIMAGGIVLAWLAFGIWFVRVRRIGRAGWTGGGAVAGTGNLPATRPLAMRKRTREQALERDILGLASPLKIATVWLVCAGLLVGVQLLSALGHGNREAIVSMVLCTLSFCAVVIGAVVNQIATRSRGLWLVGQRSRAELFAWCERRMLRTALAVALPFVLLAALVWLLLPPRPVLPPVYLLCAMLAPGATAAWYGLAQIRSNVVFDIAGGVLMFTGWLFGLAVPLFKGSTEPRWGVFIAQLALVVVLREIARRRWRRVDWPRAAPAALP
jgi:hypothetical protein